MGGVIIAPDIKKERVMIDVNGNELDPKTKKIIKKKEPEFVAPKMVEPKKPSALGDIIKAKINEKLNKLIEEKIDEALKDL